MAQIKNILIISYPFYRGFGGAAKREFYVIREFLEYIDIELYIPFRYIVEASLLSEFNPKIIKYAVDSLQELEKKGLRVPYTYYSYLENEKLIAKISSELKKDNKIHFISYLLNLEEFEKDLIRLLTKNQEISRKFDLIYTPHEQYEFIFPTYFFAEKFEKNCVFLFQETPFDRISHFKNSLKYNLYTTLLNTALKQKSKYIFEKLYRKNKIKKILTVSIEPILLSGLNKKINNYKILKIPNAFNVEILKYRKFEKEDYAVFFARLVPEKGLFEVPIILSRIKNFYGLELKTYIVGNFNNIKVKNFFLKLIKKHNLENSVKITGFLEENKLYELVSKAKVLIYPSHQDSFSLTILESLAVGTSVVAYDIPAISYVYKNLKPVRLVREGNIDEMAKKVVEILNQGLREYIEEHSQAEDFIKLYSSWKNVALEELRELEILPRV